MASTRSWPSPPGRFVDEDRHLQRLDRSLGEIAITPPMGRAALRVVLAEVARRNRVREGLVYLQVTRGVARRDFPFPATAIPATLVVTSRAPRPSRAIPPPGAYPPLTHPGPALGPLRHQVDRHAGAGAGQAGRARGGGAGGRDDRRTGMVTEGGSSTVWIVDADGALRTRHLDHAILPGCTRGALLALIETGGVTAEERAFSEAELRQAREMFGHQRHQLRQAGHGAGRRARRRWRGRAGDATFVRPVRAAREIRQQRPSLSLLRPPRSPTLWLCAQGACAHTGGTIWLDY